RQYVALPVCFYSLWPSIQLHSDTIPASAELNMYHLVSGPHLGNIQLRGGERCARLHQRKDYQDRVSSRGDEENRPYDSKRIWCFQKHSPQRFNRAFTRDKSGTRKRSESHFRISQIDSSYSWRGGNEKKV